MSGVERYEANVGSGGTLFAVNPAVLAGSGLTPRLAWESAYCDPQAGSGPLGGLPYLGGAYAGA